MTTLTLTRFAYLPWATLGRLEALRYSWYTLECPWRDNKRNESCVPEGEYAVLPDQEGKFTGYPELQAVPNRDEIIIHVANFPSDLKGCIAPGKRFNSGLADTAVWESTVAYSELVEAFGTSFNLVITSKRAVL